MIVKMACPKFSHRTPLTVRGRLEDSRWDASLLAPGKERKSRESQAVGKRVIADERLIHGISHVQV